MRSAMRLAHSVRLAAILAIAAFALHQLRYLLIPGAELARQGHGYTVDLLAPIAVLLLAGALATLIRGTEGASPAHAPLGRRIALFTLALLAVYAGQESIEAAISAGHAVGPIALLGGGGWLALPLVLAIGAVAALLASALEVVERAIAVVHGDRRLRTRPPTIRGRALPARGLRLPSSPLAFGLARRPPPVATA
jgi:hypothetical protein